MNISYRSFIEETEFYRGQIVYEWNRPEIRAAKSFISTDRSFNPYSVFNDYYNHQKDLIEKLYSKQNVLFLAPFNTGRTTISLLYALDYIFNEHRSVLFVAPNSFEKELEKKVFNRILNESKLDWLVDIHDIKQEIDEKKYIGLFPSINIIELKDLHYFLLPHHYEYSSIFESLGLLIFDDFEKYSGNLASNLYYINKRLEFIHSYYNKDYKSIQYLVLSKPFNESKSIVETIFNKEFEIMHRDDKQINKGKLFYWTPAFNKAEIVPDETGKVFKRKTQRDSFIDDTYIIALESLKKGRNTVVFYSNIPFSKDDLKNRARFIEYETRYGKIDDFTMNRFFIGNEWSDLTSQLVDKGMKWEDIETLIIAMFSGSFQEVRDSILHIGKESTEIFITMPQTPSFQFEIQHPSIEIIKGSKEVVEDENLMIFAFDKGESLFKKHTAIASYECSTILDICLKDKFIEYWKLNDDGGQIMNDSSIYCKKLFEIEGYDIFSTSYEGFYVILNEEGKILGTVDEYEIPDSFYVNSVHCQQNNRYEVSNIDFENKKIFVRHLGSFKLSISTREMISKKDETFRDYQFNDIIFLIKKCNVESKFNSYLVSTITDTNINLFDPAGESNVRLDNIEITGVEVNGLTNANDFANIFNTSLNSKISLYNQQPQYFLNNSGVFFYNLGNSDLKYLINDKIVRELLQRALTILIDCPCQNGCPGCLEIFKAHSGGVDKKGLVEYLGNILRKDNLNNIVRWKFNGIGEQGNFREDMIKFRSVRDKVLDVLRKKANMVIFNPYQEKFISEDDKKWIRSAGLCHPGKKTIYISPGFEEELFTEICAHEYTHNWQNEGNLNSIFRTFNYEKIDDDNNIWFEGKLFIEGQANFFAAKVMDYFGLREMVYSNELRHYGEYREGLILLNFLEKKFGLLNLNFMLKEAKDKNENQITQNDINNWYDESGIKALIRGEADRLINEKDMKCLNYEFLDKTSDYHRITYHMSHSIFEHKPTLLEQIKKAGLKEDSAFPQIWDILKEHFNIHPREDYDYLPCKDCIYKEKEDLDGLCMMFGSILVKDKIINTLGFTKENKTL